MIKGTAQKFETLQDGSCKLSIYYPKEIKKSVLELEGDWSITMSVSEYEALTSGKNYTVPDVVLDRLEGFGMQLADYIKSLRTEE